MWQARKDPHRRANFNWQILRELAEIRQMLTDMQWELANRSFQ